MPSTFTSNLGIQKPADGEQDAVWGDIVNVNMDIIDRAINGQVTLTLSGTSSTLTTSTSGTLTNGQYKLLVLAGTPSGTHTITISPSDAQKIYFVQNNTAQSVVFTQGSGGNVTIAANDSAIIYSDGALTTARVQNITDSLAFNSVKITGGSIDGTTVGATTASTGAFTTGSFTGDVTIADKIVHAGDTNTSICFPASDTVTVETSGAERLRIDAAGNLGFGVTPSAWGVGGKGIEFGAGNAVLTGTVGYSVIYLTNNAYFDGTNWVYKNTQTANLYAQNFGSHQWYRAPSGTAGNPITFIQDMTLDTSGNLGLGATANAAALLDLTSTTKGFRAPSMTTTQRDAIASPVGGLLIYNTTQLSYQAYNGTVWTSVGGGATGGGSNQVFVENDQTVTDNYTIPATKNAMSTGPITINAGATVTVSSGARYVVI